MEKSAILNPQTILWAVGVVIAIFLFRIILLRLLKLPISPLLFVAPRGLITILLFLAIPATQIIPFVNISLVIQVIVLTALVMMVGLMATKKNTDAQTEKQAELKAGITLN
jgi:cell volume regulation protein A